jgi:hypothetical protein
MLFHINRFFKIGYNRRLIAPGNTVNPATINELVDFIS